MKFKLLAVVFFTLTISLSSLAQETVVTASEFQKAAGKWKGKLIYLDYSSNKPYELPANLEIIRIDSSNTFKLVSTFPNEPSANSVDSLVISENGRLINDETVKLKRTLKNGDLEIVTETKGKDGNDNKDALIKHTYLIGKEILEIKKEVLFMDSKVWILRNTFSFIRN